MNIMAVIVQKNLFGQLIKAFIDRLHYRHITAKVFFSRGAGEAWIMETLQREENTARSSAARPSNAP